MLMRELCEMLRKMMVEILEKSKTEDVESTKEQLRNYVELGKIECMQEALTK